MGAHAQRWRFTAAWLMVAGLGAIHGSDAAAAARSESTQEVLARSSAADWRAPDPANTLYLELPAGRVVMELAPQFAPMHVANIKTLVGQHYFDGLNIVRVQDNYVVQWGDPQGTRDLGAAAHLLAPEFYRPLSAAANFVRLPDGDVYAPQVGFIDSWPVARSPTSKQEWLTHCYAMLGVGRDTAPDSGSGAELYVVIGHAPRHLDRNVTLVGRVLQGIELLSSLPRGNGNLGFYEKAEQYVPIRSLTLAATVPAEQQTRLQVLRTDTALFHDYVQSLRSRKGEWFVESTDRVELCNVKIPVRIKG